MIYSRGNGIHNIFVTPVDGSAPAMGLGNTDVTRASIGPRGRGAVLFSNCSGFGRELLWTLADGSGGLIPLTPEVAPGLGVETDYVPLSDSVVYRASFDRPGSVGLFVSRRVRQSGRVDPPQGPVRSGSGSD